MSLKVSLCVSVCHIYSRRIPEGRPCDWPPTPQDLTGYHHTTQHSHLHMCTGTNTSRPGWRTCAKTNGRAYAFVLLLLFFKDKILLFVFVRKYFMLFVSWEELLFFFVFKGCKKSKTPTKCNQSIFLLYAEHVYVQDPRNHQETPKLSSSEPTSGVSMKLSLKISKKT